MSELKRVAGKKSLRAGTLLQGSLGNSRRWGLFEQSRAHREWDAITGSVLRLPEHVALEGVLRPARSMSRSQGVLCLERESCASTGCRVYRECFALARGCRDRRECPALSGKGVPCLERESCVSTGVPRLQGVLRLARRMSRSQGVPGFEWEGACPALKRNVAS